MVLRAVEADLGASHDRAGDLERIRQDRRPADMLDQVEIGESPVSPGEGIFSGGVCFGSFSPETTFFPQAWQAFSRSMGTPWDPTTHMGYGAGNRVLGIVNQIV
jgi:hypothetical protein